MQAFDSYVQVFKALGEETRLKIAAILAIKGEMCVCEIADALQQPDAKISRHLAVMRSADLVQPRREGTWMHYRLRENVASIDCLAACLKKNLIDTETIQTALQKSGNSSCSQRKPEGVE